MYQFITSAVNMEVAFSAVEQYSAQLPLMKQRGFASVLMAKLWQVVESESEESMRSVYMSDKQYQFLLGAIDHVMSESSIPVDEFVSLGELLKLLQVKERNPLDAIPPEVVEQIRAKRAKHKALRGDTTVYAEYLRERILQDIGAAVLNLFPTQEEIEASPGPGLSLLR